MAHKNENYSALKIFQTTVHIIVTGFGKRGHTTQNEVLEVAMPVKVQHPGFKMTPQLCTWSILNQKYNFSEVPLDIARN